MLAGALLGVIVVILAIAFMSRRRKREAVRLGELQDQVRAEQIVKNGGPQNADEFFFLFPHACRKCGCRDLKSRDEIENPSSQVYNNHCLVACSLCGHVIERTFLGWTDRGHELPPDSEWAPVGAELSRSPYLTPEQSKNIVERWTE